jgi:8-oxo-dGTP pyrophosphatase MutT (NUDIX family)
VPWRIENRVGEFVVVKEDDGEVAGRHKTRGEAEAQRKALYANEEAFAAALAVSAAAHTPAPGVTPATATPEGAAGPQVAAGVAAVCASTGRVLLIQRALIDGEDAAGKWEFPGGGMEGDEDCWHCAEREFAEEVGVPLPDGEVVSTWLSANGVYRGFVYLVEDEEWAAGERQVEDPDNPSQGNYTEAVAWFDPAHLRNGPKMLREEVRVGTPWKLIEGAAPQREEALVAATPNQIVVDVVPRWSSGTSANGVVLDSGLAVEGTAEQFEDFDSLVASVSAPSSAFLPEGDLPGPTPFSVAEDGTVDGHLALWASCHVGYPGCVKPPREESFDFFNLGEAITADGRQVPVGKVTVDGGHAGPELSWRTAAAHYDNSATAAAVVHARPDRWGIRLSGVLLASAGDEVADTLRRSPLSGDWRRINGQLRLVAALGVNTPGFPIPRAMVAGGDVQTMYVGFDVADAAQLITEADQIAADLGLDPASKAEAIRAGILG